MRTGTTDNGGSRVETRMDAFRAPGMANNGDDVNVTGDFLLLSLGFCM
jgi:hypothetical protein